MGTAARWIGLMVGALAVSSSAGAGETIPAIAVPDAYRLSVHPAPPPVLPQAGPRARRTGLARTQAINGTLYAVIAPTYDGAGGTSSFIRLFNGASAQGTFSITVVGSPSGRTMGTAMIQVPARASPQYPLSDIISRAGAGALTGGDSGYALYLQNADAAAGYQHVTFNNGNRFFENASVCRYMLNEALASDSNSQAVINVHTTRLADYPSQIVLHNYWNAAVTYRVSVIEAGTGVEKGAVNVDTAANASYAIPMSFFEQQVGWSPSPSELHANLIVTSGGAPPYEVLGQAIVNSALAAEINMSAACAVNRPAAAAIPVSFDYQTHCAACHGADARGIAGVGVDLLNNEFIRTRTNAELIAFLKIGRMPGDPQSRINQLMPSFEYLSDADLAGAAQYLRNLNP